MVAGGARVLQAALESGLALVGMLERELGPPDAVEGHGVPAAHAPANALRGPLPHLRLPLLEILGGLRVAGERRLVVALRVGDHGETVEEVTLDLSLAPAGEARVRELQTFLEDLGRPVQVAHVAIGGAELGV